MIKMHDIDIGSRLDEITGSPRRSHIVLQRLAGRTYHDIGRELGVSRQAVHRHIVVLQSKCPEIGKLAARRW